MAENLLGVTLILLLLVAGWLLLRRPRKTLAGDMDVPMDVEKQRAKSEADMAAPITEADAEEAAPLVAFVEEISTGEQLLVPMHPPVRRRHVYKPPSPRQMAVMRERALAPVRAFAADPLTAPIPGRHRAAEPVLFGDQVEAWFAPALNSTPFPAAPVEPEPWALGGFTEEWNVGDVERMVAAARAEAVNAR